MTQTLTKQQIIDANIKAVEGGYLAALAGMRNCRYRYDETVNGHPCGCAIGVALDEETIARVMDEWKNGANVASLVDEKLVSIRAVKWAEELQDTHDAWLGGGGNELRAKLHRARYFEMIGIPDPGALKELQRLSQEYDAG